MKTIHRLGIFAIPACFVCAGAGMLLLLTVEYAAGNFYQQVRSQQALWIYSHIILLISTVLLLPAALSIRSAIIRPAAGILGTAMVVIIAPTAILLAGQYAIDFVVPLMIQVGGDALKVHRLLSANPLVNNLFYNLPNLVFLALMILSIALVWSRALARIPAAILIINWLAVILGNLIHPAFQRSAILLLAASYMPLVLQLWRDPLLD